MASLFFGRRHVCRQVPPCSGPVVSTSVVCSLVVEEALVFQNVVVPTLTRPKIESCFIQLGWFKHNKAHVTLRGYECTNMHISGSSSDVSPCKATLFAEP